jgi:hypothetical protein
MSIRRHVPAVLATLTAVLGLGVSPLVNAEPAAPYPCERGWLGPRPRTVCEDDPSNGPASSPDLPGGPEAPVPPGGPAGPRPVGPR